MWMRKLRKDLEFDSTAIRPPFDSHSTAIRRRYDHSTTFATTVGLTVYLAGLINAAIRSAQLRLAGQQALVCYVSRTDVKSRSNRRCNHRFSFLRCYPVAVGSCACSSVISAFRGLSLFFPSTRCVVFKTPSAVRLPTQGSLGWPVSAHAQYCVSQK